MSSTSPQPELAVLCLLFLRGPQTAGEIRTRCTRIYEFPDLSAVHDVLKQLEENPDGPYVAMLPRQAGHKESRYAHLFCGDVEDIAIQPAFNQPVATDDENRIEELEVEVGELKEKLLDLEGRLEGFIKQFE